MNYQDNGDGTINLNGSSVPKALDNPDYKRILEEVDRGDSTIEPYVQPLEELRQTVIERIKQEAVTRISDETTTIDSFNTAKLVYIQLWDVLGATSNQKIQNGREIVNHALTAISQANVGDRAYLDSYDPEIGWPE